MCNEHAVLFNFKKNCMRSSMMCTTYFPHLIISFVIAFFCCCYSVICTDSSMYLTIVNCPFHSISRIPNQIINNLLITIHHYDKIIYPHENSSDYIFSLFHVVIITCLKHFFIRNYSTIIILLFFFHHCVVNSSLFIPYIIIKPISN